MLGIMQQNFQEISRDCFVTLNKSLVRPQLEYANNVWALTRICDTEKNQTSSKTANKMIRGLSGLKYEERLCVLQLPTLIYRQLRGI